MGYLDLAMHSARASVYTNTWRTGDFALVMNTPPVVSQGKHPRTL